MKKTDLTKYLKKNGCSLLRQGNKHEVWIHEMSGRITAVPRHNEIKKGTARKICETLEIPIPPSL